MLCRFGLKQSRESLEKLRHGAFVVWSFVWFCLFVIASTLQVSPGWPASYRNALHGNKHKTSSEVDCWLSLSLSVPTYLVFLQLPRKDGTGCWVWRAMLGIYWIPACLVGGLFSPSSQAPHFLAPSPTFHTFLSTQTEQTQM